MSKFAIIFTLLVINSANVRSQDILGQLAEALNGALEPVIDPTFEFLKGMINTEGVSHLIHSATSGVANLLHPDHETSTKALDGRYKIGYELHQLCNENWNATGAMMACYSKLRKNCYRIPTVNEIEAEMERYPECTYSSSPIKRDEIPPIFFDTILQQCAGVELIPAQDTLGSMKTMVMKMMEMLGSRGNAAEMGEIATLILDELTCMF